MRVEDRPYLWCLAATAAFALAPAVLHAAPQVIVNDSWTDGGRDNGADSLDTDWWTSTTSSAIEVSSSAGLGLVSGTSGRGIHGTFTPQTLATGEALKVTFTFKTPATVGTNLSAGFKIGLFNTLGNNGLKADLSASSTTPNPIYNPLPGYMMDYDVNTTTANIQFREKDPVPGSTGQLLGTTTGFVSIAGGGAVYTFTGNTTYTGVYMLTKTAGGLNLMGSLSSGTTLLSTFTTSDPTASTSTLDLLGFHANTNAFGSSNTAGTAGTNLPDNGIDFPNITIEFIPVPEPSAAGVLVLGLGLAARRRR